MRSKTPLPILNILFICTLCALMLGRAVGVSRVLKHTPSIPRILVVEDYEPLRRLICSDLQSHNLEIAGEASDGLEAVLKAERLMPDLVLIDISLPLLNGLEATRRLLRVAPQAKILFFSDESSTDVVREAFNSGASGYIHKLRTYSELMPAIETILRGGQFVGSGLEGEFSRNAVESASGRHDMLIYSDAAALLDSFCRFVGETLKAGGAAIIVATKWQLDGVLQSLNAKGVDTASAARQRILVPVDVEEFLSTVMIDNVFDEVRARSGVVDLVEAVAKDANGAHIAACGVCGYIMCARGNTAQAASAEAVWDDLGGVYKLDMLCAYAAGTLTESKNHSDFKRIRALHSAVYSR